MTDRFTARRRDAADRVRRLVDHFSARMFGDFPGGAPWYAQPTEQAKAAAAHYDRAHDLWCRTLGNYDRPIGPAHRLP